MMDTIHNYVSYTSAYIRKEYVDHDKVMSLYESSMISKQALEEILPDLERIEHMTDILGQRALMAVMPDKYHNSLSQLGTSFNRSALIFIHRHDLFIQAEDLRRNKEYDKRNLWDYFNSTPNQKINIDHSKIDAFKNAVEIFFYSRPMRAQEIKFYHVEDEGEIEKIEINIYYFLLSDIIDNPLHKMTLISNIKTGIIEVTGFDKEARHTIAQFFIEHILQKSSEILHMKKYDMTSSLLEQKFATHPQDGIDMVKINTAIFKPYQGGSLIRLEDGLNEAQRFSDMCQKTFQNESPFNQGYTLNKIKLWFRFKADAPYVNERNISVTLKWPASSNLNNKPFKEKNILKKYLNSWGIEG